MLKHINALLEMAEHFSRTGEKPLADECRRTANAMLDALLYFRQAEEGAQNV